MKNAIDKRRYFIVIEIFKRTKSLLSWNAWIHLQCNRFVKSTSSMQNFVLYDWLCWIWILFWACSCWLSKKFFVNSTKNNWRFKIKFKKFHIKTFKQFAQEFEKSQSNIRFDVCRRKRTCEKTKNENYENVKINQEFTKSIRRYQELTFCQNLIKMIISLISKKTKNHRLCHCIIYYKIN